LVAGVLVAAQAGVGQNPPGMTADPKIAAALQQVSAQRIQSDIEKLVSFGTRLTLSAQDAQSIAAGHGIGAARDDRANVPLPRGVTVWLCVVSLDGQCRPGRMARAAGRNEAVGVCTVAGAHGAVSVAAFRSAAQTHVAHRHHRRCAARALAAPPRIAR